MPGRRGSKGECEPYGLLKDFQPDTDPDAAFVQSLVDALRQWQFSPAKLNDVPQECQISVTAKFVAGQD